MKRYEPIVNIGIFTNTTGTYVKVEDVEKAIDTLIIGRSQFLQAEREPYIQALEELRLQVRAGV